MRLFAAHPITAADADRLGKVMKALADPSRLQILGHLRAGPVRPRELQQLVGLAQPTIGHHLRTLLDAGLVRRTREGPAVHIWLDRDAVAAVGKALR